MSSKTNAAKHTNNLFSKIVDNFCWLYFVKMDQNFRIVLMPILKFKTWWDSSQQVCTLLFDNAGFVICQLSFLHREQIHELHYWYNRAFNYHFLMLDLLTAMPWFVLTASLHCRKYNQDGQKSFPTFAKVENFSTQSKISITMNKV